MLSLDQVLNSAGHGHGTNASCISSPCRGSPVHQSQHRQCSRCHSPHGAQPCSARRAPLVPSPCLGHALLLHPPLHCCSDASPSARWDAGNVQLRDHLPRLPAPAPLLPQPPWVHRQHRVSQAPGFTGVLPAWHLHTRAKWDQGSSSPHAWPSLEAYLSRMRKSSTIRTMGRKMRSRLSISAASSSASSRR